MNPDLPPPPIPPTPPPTVLPSFLPALFRLVLGELNLHWLPVHREWRLNERHYGALQGLNKAETAEKHGEAQVKIWRRAYDIPPPALELDDPRHPSQDRRYTVHGALRRREGVRTGGEGRARATPSRTYPPIPSLSLSVLQASPRPSSPLQSP
jgi:hypothetical protein